MRRGNDEAGHLTAPDQPFQDLPTSNSAPGHPHPLMYSWLLNTMYCLGQGQILRKSPFLLSFLSGHLAGLCG